jgi:hypothetical protein
VNNAQRLFDVLRRDVQIIDGTNGVWTGREHPQPTPVGPFDEGTGTDLLQSVADNVRFDRRWIDCNPLNLRQPLREARRQRVDLAKPRAMMI